MSKIIPRISIAIITYNQEGLIGRALDSILIQKDWVYEVIVSDDCSTDSNWDVILGYRDRYPEIVKPFRNEHNLGIFGNMESVWSKPTGDIIFLLSGDDEFCDGLFEEALNLVGRKNIDYRKELFALYFDYKVVWPNKMSRVYRNDLISKGFDPFSLKLRGLISPRTVAFSGQILKMFYPVRKDIGIFADGLQDIQLQLFSTHSYYSPFVGSIYHAGIGVSMKTNINERLMSTLNYFDELEKVIDWLPKDRRYLRFKREKSLMMIRLSLKHLMWMMAFYFWSIDWRYGLRGLEISETFFKIYKYSKIVFYRKKNA